MKNLHPQHPQHLQPPSRNVLKAALLAGLALGMAGTLAPQVALAQAATASKHAQAAHDHHDGHHSGHGSSAIGVPGKSAQATRTVEISMSDTMRFTPDSVAVKRGETVRFVVKNTGQTKHEFNLGTAAELKKHYALMLKFPEMEHDEPNVASVEPGKTGEVVWQFTKAGTVSFACLHPGHFEAGMKGTIKVSR